MGFELYRWITVDKPRERRLFSDEQFKTLSKIILNRHLELSKDKPVFMTFPKNTYSLLYFWCFDPYKTRVIF
jgi:hypothetical protein